MIFPAGNEADRDVMQAVLSGALDEAELDARLDELLDATFAVQSGVGHAAPVDFAAHHALARRAAAESIVLLKNEAQILPLAAGTRVAVIGDFAKTPRYQGAGSSLVNPTRLNDYHELETAGLSIVGYAQGFRRYGGGSDRLVRKACALAQQADVVLLYLGLDEYSEAEGVDRTHMRIPENQLALLSALHKTNPRIVALLSCGSPVEMDWETQTKAILHCNLGGQAIAGAAADVLTGRINPSGKLAESYPFRYEDTPACGVFPGGPITTEYREGLYVGYRYYLSANVPVRYPFGFGLSYTAFALSDLSFADGKASLTITNTGERAGAEVVQLYVASKTAGIYRPKRTLAGFEKLQLQAGESKRVVIPTPERAFQYWDTSAHGWRTQAGSYVLYAGTSCTDTPLSTVVALDGAAPERCPAQLAAYERADVKHITDEAFSALLGHEIPARTLDLSRPLTMNDTVGAGMLRKGFPRFLCGFIRLARRVCQLLGKRNEALYIGVALQMPYRSLWRGTNGAFSREMLEGFLMMLNGRFFRGLGRVVTGSRHKKSLHKPMYDQYDQKEAGA